MSWHILIISALSRQRQEDCFESTASLIYRTSFGPAKASKTVSTNSDPNGKCVIHIRITHTHGLRTFTVLATELK